jgi:quercetin dioxygenase-like cupin family protein
MGSGPVQTGWHHYDLDFDFFYVLKGVVKIVTESGQSLSLIPKSSGIHPNGLRHNFYDFSDDFEAVLIRSPALAEPILGKEGFSGRRGDYQIYSEDLYQRSEGANRNGVIVGLRPYLAYRTFGVLEATDGRLNIHESRVVGPPPAEGTGWHRHASSNWYMVLSGHNEVGFEHLPESFIFSAGDAFSQGPNIPHVVGFNTADYAVIAISIPAAYKTVPLPTPPGFQFKYGARHAITNDKISRRTS